MDSGFKDSCTGAFHAQARWERIVVTSEQFLARICWESKGEKIRQTNSPQKNPKRKYMSQRKYPHQNLRENNFSKLIHFRKIQRENPKRKYMSKKNASPKSKGEKIQQKNSPQKNPKRKYMSQKKYLTKTWGRTISAN